MKFMRLHWFDVGLALALVVGIFLIFTTASPISFLLMDQSHFLVHPPV